MPPSELKEWLEELPAMRATLTKAYSEEMRCMVYFQVLVMADASALVRREKVLFQKFLRDARFKLMSNGIMPPKGIFDRKSFASIDVNVVDVLALMTLRPPGPA